MPSIINATTTTGVAVTGDTSGALALQTNNGTTAVTIDTSQNVGVGTTSPSARLTVGRVDSSNEGGQIDLCRASDNASAWAVDVFGNTSTPAFRIVDNVAAAERVRVDSSGNLLFNSGYGSVATAYGCRAWVNFNGQGTVAIRSSGNVSSITDNGTGDYTVNFTNAMPDTNYVVSACGTPATTNGNWRFPVVYGKASSDFYQAPATSNFRVIWASNDVTAPNQDILWCQIAVFR